MMLLSHSPQRLSIKEISEFTQYHRNTVGSTVKKLVESGKIKSIGNNKHEVYYFESVADYYLRLSATLNNLDIPGLNEELKLKIIKQFGTDFVHNALKQFITIGPDEFSHDNLIEALVHVKMSYPFNELIFSGDESKTSFKHSVMFEVDDTLDKDDFELRIYPCLCKGDENNYFACHFVEGVLTGGIIGACGVTDVKVSHIGRDIHPERGAFCRYRIQSPISSKLKNS